MILPISCSLMRELHSRDVVGVRCKFGEGVELPVVITHKQWALLLSLQPSKFVKGANVGLARALVVRGLAELEDNGEFKLTPRGKSDGERWLASVTELGKLVRSAK